MPENSEAEDIYTYTYGIDILFDVKVNVNDMYSRIRYVGMRAVSVNGGVLYYFY